MGVGEICPQKIISLMGYPEGRQLHVEPMSEMRDLELDP